MDQSALFREIDSHFSIEELRALASIDLGIGYEDLPFEQEKEIFIRKLIQYCSKQPEELLPKLAQKLKAACPDGDWDALFGQPQRDRQIDSGDGDDAINTHAGDKVDGDKVGGDKIGQQINSGGGPVLTGPVTAGDDVILGDQIINIYPSKPEKPAGQDLTWQQVLHYSQMQREVFWRDAQGRAERPGTYVPGLFVPSQQTESELQAFLAGEEAAMIILGETGMGKTNLLCHWTWDQSQAGHAIFYYDCGGSIKNNIEDHIGDDLKAESSQELSDLLHQISHLAAESEKQFLLILDAINEFRRDNMGTADLLRQIDALVGRLPRSHVKVIFSCRTVPWQRVQNTGTVKLLEHRYYRPKSTVEQFLLLQPFDRDTFKNAYDKYQAHFDLKTDYNDLPPSVRENLMRPSLLRMAADAYTGRHIPVTENFFLWSIFERLYEDRVKSWEDQEFIEELLDAMYECENSVLPFNILKNKYPNLYAKIRERNPDGSYQRLLARGVLSETPGSFGQRPQVRFLHDLFGSYVLARWKRQQDSDEQLTVILTELVRDKRNFHLAWEAALILLLEPLKQMDQTNQIFDLFATGAQSQDPYLRQLAVDALEIYHADQPQAARQVTDHLLQEASPEAHLTALKVAFLIGQPAQPDIEKLSAGAKAQDPYLRQLAVEVLVKYHAVQPQAALDIIEHLLGLDSTEAQYTALKAAYLIGQPAQSVFLNIASSNMASRRNRHLRSVTKDALFLKWFDNKEFVKDLFNALIVRINRKSPFVLEFFITLSIIIYINRCDEEGLPQLISDWYHELVTKQLRLDQLDNSRWGPAFNPIIVRVVSEAMALPVMKSLDSKSFTAYKEQYPTEEDREPHKEVLHLVIPGSDLSPKLINMAEMLDSPITFLNLLAAMPLAVQAAEDFEKTEPLMRQLFEQAGGHGRLWIIISLAVQLKDTPSQWVEMLEDFTHQFIEDNPDIYYEEGKGFFEEFDIVLIPLGLAYGKRDTGMPLFEKLIKEGLNEFKKATRKGAAGEQGQLLSRTLDALGPVGFYYPQAVIETLGAAIGEADLKRSEILKMLEEPLSLMRILHLDEVDDFLQRIGAKKSFMRDVAAATNIRRLSKYTFRLGIYNSTIYDALRHPKMRSTFLIPAMEVLIDEQVPKAFLKYYTKAAIDMSREYDYQLIEWTRPD